MKGTALASLLLTAETLIFLFGDFNKLYMLLLTPLIVYGLAQTGLLQGLFLIPIIGSLLSTITQIFVSLVTLGVKPSKNTIENDLDNILKEYKDEKKQ